MTSDKEQVVGRKGKCRDEVREFGRDQIMKVLGNHCEDCLAFTFNEWEAIEGLEETSVGV